MHGEDENAVSHRESDDVWQGPLYRDCGTCNFMRRTYGRAWCIWCAKDIERGCRTLAANVAVAGALCEAFALGQRAPLGVNRWNWRPGSLRPATGHALPATQHQAAKEEG